MPFIDRGELDKLRQFEAEVVELRRRLDLEAAVGRVAAHAREQVTEYEEGGALLSEAESMARMAVAEQARVELREDLTIGLIEERREEVSAQVRTEEGPGLRRELHSLFETDGTYDRVEEGVRSDLRRSIHDELVEERREQIRKELDTPEEREKFAIRMRPEIMTAPDMQDFRDGLRQELETGWRSEAEADAQRAIESEERSREAAFKEEYATAYREGRSGKQYQASIRESLEREWRDKTIEEVNEQLRDEELSKILKLRRDHELEKVRRETLAKELVGRFEGRGIDTSDIEEGSEIKLYLGKAGISEVTKRQIKDSYYKTYEDVTVQIEGVYYRRILTLTSMGDGHFIMVKDTLSASSSPYEHEYAIPEGTVVALGRVVNHNGERKMEHRIAADVTLHYDDDTSTPEEFIDTFAPVANIEIDGVSARPLEFVEKLN